MQTNIEKLENCKTILTLKASSEEWKSKIEKAYNKLEEMSSNEQMRKIAEWRYMGMVEHNSAISSSYDDGYNSGKKDGYDSGNKDGYNRGKKDGYTSGKKDLVKFLKENGIRTRVKKKISEGSEEILDSLRKGYVSYVISTRDIDSIDQETDGASIRRCAVENNIPMFTALDTVKVLLDVLEEITLCISTIDE